MKFNVQGRELVMLFASSGFLAEKTRPLQGCRTVADDQARGRFHARSHGVVAGPEGLVLLIARGVAS
jgi:hypothetical protein